VTRESAVPTAIAPVERDHRSPTGAGASGPRSCRDQPPGSAALVEVPGPPHRQEQRGAGGQEQPDPEAAVDRTVSLAWAKRSVPLGDSSSTFTGNVPDVSASTGIRSTVFGRRSSMALDRPPRKRSLSLVKLMTTRTG